MQPHRTILLLAMVLVASLSTGCAAPNLPFVAIADNATLKAMAYEPSTGGLLKAGPGGVFHFASRTGDWQSLPLRGPIPHSGLSQVAVSLANPKLIVTAGPEAGILASTDGGQNWTAINSNLPSKRIGAVATHSFNSGTLYAWVDGKAIYKTEDGGGQWKRMDDGPPVSGVLALAHSTLPGSMNTGWLYAAAPEGLYLSMDCF